MIKTAFGVNVTVLVFSITVIAIHKSTADFILGGFARQLAINVAEMRFQPFVLIDQIPQLA